MESPLPGGKPKPGPLGLDSLLLSWVGSEKRFISGSADVNAVLPITFTLLKLQAIKLFYCSPNHLWRRLALIHFLIDPFDLLFLDTGYWILRGNHPYFIKHPVSYRLWHKR
jgi:hypothetical protein